MIDDGGVDTRSQWNVKPHPSIATLHSYRHLPRPENKGSHCNMRNILISLGAVTVALLAFVYVVGFATKPWNGNFVNEEMPSCYDSRLYNFLNNFWRPKLDPGEWLLRLQLLNVWRNFQHRSMLCKHFQRMEACCCQFHSTRACSK